MKIPAHTPRTARPLARTVSMYCKVHIALDTDLSLGFLLHKVPHKLQREEHRQHSFALSSVKDQYKA